MTRLRAARISIRLALVAFVGCMLLVAALWAIAPPTGHREVVIRSGSMSPAIPVGSLAILETVDPDELRPGDVVTVQLLSGGYLTHRVAELPSNDTHRVLVLHGDANPSDVTESIHADQVVGRVVAVLPGMGFLAWWLSRPTGIVACFALVGLSLVLIDALRDPGPRRRRWRRFGRRLAGTRLGDRAAATRRSDPAWCSLAARRPGAVAGHRDRRRGSCPVRRDLRRFGRRRWQFVHDRDVAEQRLPQRGQRRLERRPERGNDSMARSGSRPHGPRPASTVSSRCVSETLSRRLPTSSSIRSSWWPVRVSRSPSARRSPSPTDRVRIWTTSARWTRVAR